MSSNKTSAGILPAVLLVIIAVALLFDWNINGGFGTLSRIVAWVGGAAFIISLIVAIARTNKVSR
jgi:hypothetical protein